VRERPIPVSPAQLRPWLPLRSRCDGLASLPVGSCEETVALQRLCPAGTPIVLSTWHCQPRWRTGLAGVAPPPRLSTGSHHGERCADNVLAASGARPSSTTHYSPGVISSSRAGRQLEGRYAHGVQVCGLRERGWTNILPLAKADLVKLALNA